MFFSQCFKGLRCQCEFGGVCTPGQADGSHNLASVVIDMTSKVGERASLTDEVIDKKVMSTILNLAFEERRRSKPLPTACAGVIDHVDLNNGSFHAESELLSEQSRERCGNPVEALAFQGVHGNQERSFDWQTADGFEHFRIDHRD